MKVASIATVLAALLLVQGQAAPKQAEVGKPAPTFRLNDHSGKLQTVGGKSDSWTVVAFYPKALTPG